MDERDMPEMTCLLCPDVTGPAWKILDHAKVLHPDLLHDGEEPWERDRWPGGIARFGDGAYVVVDGT